MTPARLATLIRFRTKTDSVTFTDAEILALFNTFKDELCAEVVEVNEDLFVMRFYRNLIVNQRAYAFPGEMLTKMKFAEAILDGTKTTRLVEFDPNSVKGYPLNTEADIRATFAGKKPAYDINARSLKIFSEDAIIAVTDGLILHATQYPADLSALTGTTDMSVDPSATTFGIPRPMHGSLLDRVVIEWKSSQDKPVPLTEREAAWETNWQKVKDAMKDGNLDREIIPATPVEDGQDY